MNTVPVRPASTVVLLRDRDDQIEVLLVRRNRALAFAGGFWVFPGGAVDEGDFRAAGDNPDEAPRFAAAREAEEEAGVRPDPEGMVLMSHWTTPVGEVKRFSTWFYAAALPSDCEVRIDEDEIHDWRFVTVADALSEHRSGGLAMLPPTYITLCALDRYSTATEALAGEHASPCPHILPRLVSVEGEAGFTTLYPGDIAYEGQGSEGLNDPGPRHRAVLIDGAWHYSYDGVSDAPALFPQDGARNA